jgi:hypothetical protein
MIAAAAVQPIIGPVIHAWLFFADEVVVAALPAWRAELDDLVLVSTAGVPVIGPVGMPPVPPKRTESAMAVVSISFPLDK